MMTNVEPLATAISWHGKLYPQGCTLVPLDLAEALGQPAPQSEAAEPTQPLDPSPSAAPTPKTRRRKAE